MNIPAFFCILTLVLYLTGAVAEGDGHNVGLKKRIGQACWFLGTITLIGAFVIAAIS